MIVKKYSKKLTKNKFILLLSLSMITACGHEQTTSDSTLKIYGGTKVIEGDWPSAVGIVGSNFIFCSGTIVHPRLVITAAHCIEDQEKLGIYMGSGNGDDPVTKTHQGVKQGLIKHKQKDVGWISFSEDINIEPSEIVPILYKKEEIETVLKPNAYSHIIGYGKYKELDTNKEGNGGIKYEASTSIDKKDPIMSDGNEIKIGGNDKIKGACFGDSGGPAYGKTADGEWRVYGVVSGGLVCGHGGVYGLMHRSICEVEEQSGIDLELGNYCTENNL